MLIIDEKEHKNKTTFATIYFEIVYFNVNPENKILMLHIKLPANSVNCYLHTWLHDYKYPSYVHKIPVTAHNMLQRKYHENYVTKKI